MIEKFCDYLTKKMRQAMPDIDDERAEIINFGLQNIIGEFPKIIIVIALGFLLNVGWLTLINFLILMPYRTFAGGFHAKTHIACIIFTTTLYCGPAFLCNFIHFEPVYIKYIVIAIVWLFGIIMIKKYAPADTENVPILRKKERKQKRILSYIVLTIELIIAIFIPMENISAMIIISVFLETLTITKLAYKIFKNKYSYEVYDEHGELLNQN